MSVEPAVRGGFRPPGPFGPPDRARVTDPAPPVLDDEYGAEEEPAPDLGVDHVLVRMSGDRYAVHAPDVAAVVHVPAVTRLPGLPSWVLGVGSWRGRVLALVDLRPPLGLATTPLPSSARTVVLSVDGVEVGLVVEAVTGLAPISDTALAPAPSGPSPEAAALLRGVAPVAATGSGAPVAVLDTGAVLALRGRLAQARGA